MQVILMQNVPGLGKIDEIKEVADGYARNYLFAKNLAMPVSKNTLQEADNKKKKKEKQAVKELAQEQETATKLDGIEIEVKEKVSKGGTLYAAFGAQKIATMLKEKGVRVDKKQIEVKSIKEVGEYDIKIKFSHGIEAEIKLTVMAL